MRNQVRGLLALLTLIAVFTLGAYVHEMDIQRECANTGLSNSSTWSGELICKPKYVLKENV